MYIAMNRFQIAIGRGDEFEEIWRQRESHLDGVPGFREFHLLRSPEQDGGILYASHTVWDAQEDFEAWTNSEAFRNAHAKAHTPAGLHLGHPQFEGFEAVL